MNKEIKSLMHIKNIELTDEEQYTISGGTGILHRLFTQTFIIGYKLGTKFLGFIGLK